MKQIESIKHWFYQYFLFIISRNFRGVYIKVNQDCEWMPELNNEISSRRVYYYHAK